MSISQVYKTSQFRGVLKATNPNDGTDNNFFVTPSGTEVSQIPIGVISLVKIGNIIFMNIPLFNFMTTGNDDEIRLEILWTKKIGNLLTYEPMSKYDPEFIPNTNNLILNSSKIYTSYNPANDIASNSKVPIPATPISPSSLDIGDYIRYCIQKIPSTGVISACNSFSNIDGGLPESTVNFGFSVTTPTVSYIPIPPVANAGNGVSGSKGITDYNKYINFNFKKLAVANPNDPLFKIELVITNSYSQYFLNDQMRYPITVLPFIYTYYV